jgi:hypothetical protein
MAPSGAHAVGCERTITVNVAAIDTALVFNRIGAQNVNAMVYALERDVINVDSELTLNNGGAAVPGRLALRPDKRPRPIVIRAAEGDCLTVNFRNLLTSVANPFDPAAPGVQGQNPALRIVDEQVADRYAGIHFGGLELLERIEDDASYVGRNPNSLVPAGGSATYKLYAAKEGVFQITSYGATFGSEGLQGNNANGLFGAMNVEPRRANFYRSQIAEEEMRLATTGTTADGHPIINYEAAYPGAPSVWADEGKAGLPVINMLKSLGGANYELVHTDLNAVITGPGGASNPFFSPSAFPIEATGKRNPTVPNRLQPFREYTVVFHDEVATQQAFPFWYTAPGGDPALLPWRYLLEGVKDGFMINYGSGGIGSEIIASRLGVGPMHDCLDCAYEEFFLTSFTVSDPAMVVDVPANTGLENCSPANLAGTCLQPGQTGPKATLAFYPEDPANIHHSYMNDAVRFRNIHVGKEQHVFHLHNHQWLFSASDDNGNYLDAQGIGPGSGYTYEINFGGSGNRNKSAGDAIFHCHFYPHFAQGMWEHWRNHDVFEAGTLLEVSGGASSFHTTPYALGIGKPAAGARALPDGEIVAGTPIPALVPLPKKPLAPMPAPGVTVKANPNTTIASDFHGATPATTVPVGSLASIPRNPDGSLNIDKNPGYPFWIAGMEDIVGQRPPTPPLDMDPAAGGFDGGLPRHALDGYAAGGESDSSVSLIDFSKEVTKAKGVFYPEGGTDLEKLVMDFHGLTRCHDTYLSDGTLAPCALGLTSTGAKLKTGGFITNGYRDPDINGPGVPVQAGSVYHDPCMDDTGKRLLAGQKGNFFSSALPAAAADPATKTLLVGPATFGANKPRVYAGTNIQFDVVLNKMGYHYPQQRIVALWEDAIPVIDKKKPPEPLVMRLNTLDCAMYKHSNLVPKEYEMDDYQVRTPTDIIGQHIHLPKWDLTTTDGSANGWNYEDGTLSPGAVRERIHAINAAVADPTIPDAKVAGTGSGAFTPPADLVAKPHPFFSGVLGDARAACPNGPFCGARATLQRWFADPVLNRNHQDRGLGIIFTHDHYGPSTHQQIGLYATVLVEPAGSKWAHNETGTQLGDRVTPASLSNVTAAGRGDGGRIDGGPTSWQAQILPPATADSYREFYFEYSDFQHAYLPGVYVGADEKGQPLPGATPLDRFKGVASIADAFRSAINPPARLQANPVFPDLVLEVAQAPFCPERPCPQAISVQDPGVLVNNYRMESVSDRIFDPNTFGPDGVRGTQAAGLKGDLAFAFQTRTDRAIPALNTKFGAAPAGYSVPTAPAVGKFPINQPSAVQNGDPFTPMMRAYSGDRIRVKMQAGGHEEEHSWTVHGLKWLQGGSGNGSSPTSGWRNAQAGGISEQFTFNSPVTPVLGEKGITSDHLFTAGAGFDGWWSGQWGIMRTYDFRRSDLSRLPNSIVPFVIANPLDFKLNGKAVCPKTAPDRNYDVSAVLANDILPNPGFAFQTLGETDPLSGLAGLTFGQEVASTTSLNPLGGTLIYNPRPAVIPQVTLPPEIPGDPPLVIGGHTGPLHDPTAILYVRTQDLDPVTGKLKSGVVPEPITIRAAAGDCINVTLRNKLPGDLNANGFFDDNPDLPSFGTLQGVTKRQNIPGLLGGTTTFNNNLLRPSSHVGLHPQLVSYDITRDDGTNVGINGCYLGNCSSILSAPETVRPGQSKTITWYAGDLAPVKTGSVNILGVTVNTVRLNPTPVEFGGVSLGPADKIKQGQKGLFGSLVIEPKGSTWIEDADNPVSTRKIRTAATVDPTPLSPNSGDEFRDFSLLLSKHLTIRWADGQPVEHENGEGFGIPEDAQEAGQQAFNYGSEPMWFRFGVSANAPFGGAGCGTPASNECFGDVANAHEAYSNNLLINQGTLTSNAPVAAGDPATPVFEVKAGQEARIRLSSASTSTRGSTFSLHGHNWQRAPYRVGSTGFPSQVIGNNPLSMNLGAQESITGQQHFDIRLPMAGGSNAVPGDYLFRDLAGFGNADGLWGILRVAP